MILTAAGVCVLVSLCSFTTVKAEGRSFAVAFPPTKNGVTSGRLQIIIDSKYVFARVTVATQFSTNSYAVSPYAPVRLNQGGGRRTINGIENKGYIITSDYDISVRVLNEAPEMFADVAFAQPLDDTTRNFILANEANTNFGDCADGDTAYSFVVMIGRDDTTVVETFDPANNRIETIYLDTYTTYTAVRLFDDRQTSFSRYEIRSSKPIGVMVGNACFSGGDSSIGSPVFDFVPAISKLGLDHIIPPLPIPYSNAQDKRVSVIAAENLVLTMTGNAGDIQLDKGQRFTRLYPAEDSAIVLCSQPCLVSMTARNYGPSFMSFIPPVAAYNTAVYFTQAALASSTPSDITLIVTTGDADSIDSYELDGNAIPEEDWVCEEESLFPRTFCSIQIPILNKPYRLTVNASDASFMAMTMVGIADEEGNYIGRGYGSQVGTFADPREEVIPPDVGSPTVPLYNAYHEANFTTVNLTALDDQCQLNYASEFKTQTTAWIPVINAAVGSDLCADVEAGGVSIATVTTGLGVNTDNVYGLVDMKWRFRVEETTAIGVAEDCVTEIMDFIAVYENWDQLLTPIEGCAELELDGDRFNVIPEGWDCETSTPGLTSDPSPYTDDLKVRINLYGYFFTEDNAIITGGCSNQFRAGYNESTVTQVETVNTQIDDEVLCVGRPVKIQTNQHIWTTSGDKGTATQLLDFDPPAELNFVQIQRCITEVAEFMEDQLNWNQPIIPEVGNCPFTDFTDFSFEERDRYYTCP